MVKVGIVGISGYSGLLIFELLLNHSDVRITYVCANQTQGAVADIWPRLKGRTDLYCDKFDLNKALELSDIFFLAVPHSNSLKITPKLLKAKKKVIDLSADYRLPDASAYPQWYDFKHSDPLKLKKSVYGLPEIYREDIKRASLIANPGCYPTAAILALAPIVATYGDSIQSIIIDAKSGVSGAGRNAKPELMFAEVQDNFKAYKVLQHQHTPEINLYLSALAEKPVDVTFIPHLIPINRGIFETIYVQFKDVPFPDKKIFDIYKKFYKTEPFIRILPSGSQPELKNVVGTNYCDIGLAFAKEKNLLVVISAIDNLMKGAAGQAVHNLNLMCGFPEDKGLV